MKTADSKEAKSKGRRDFLKTGAVGTGLILANPFNIIGSPLKSADEVKVAVVGCGGRGRGVAFSNIPKIPGCKMVAVCDVVKSRREGFKARHKKTTGENINAYEDFYDMIQKETLDAIVLTTPDFWHMQHTVDALEAGIHVYCEKAMSNKLEDAYKMAAAMKKTGKLL